MVPLWQRWERHGGIARRYKDHKMHRLSNVGVPEEYLIKLMRHKDKYQRRAENVHGEAVLGGVQFSIICK